VQERVYAGSALKDVAGTADVMYQAGVACTGCHSEAQIAGAGQATMGTKVSGSKQCTACHANPGFGKMLTMWQQGTKARLEELQATLNELEGKQPAAAASAEAVAQRQKLIASAKEKLQVVTADGSYGAHNFAYVSTILDAAEADLNKCRSLAATPDTNANPEVALK
jgi:hypothetical protein